MQKHIFFKGYLLSGIFLLLSIFLLELYQPVSLLKSTPVVDEFSAGKAKEVLYYLYQDLPSHPSGTYANEQLKNKLKNSFEQLGYTTELQKQFVCSKNNICSYISNIISYKNIQPNEDVVQVNVHYDSINAGPGVSDNGVNLAIALELARLFNDKKTLNPLMFVFTDAEEIDLLGAELFTKHPLASQVSAVINLEARGTKGDSVLFETIGHKKTLMQWLDDSGVNLKSSSLFYDIYRLLPNETDLTVYQDTVSYGYNLAFLGGSEGYHSTNDDLKHVDLNSLEQQGKASTGLLNVLLNQKLNKVEQTNDDVVFFDVSGGLFFTIDVTILLMLSVLSIIVFVYLIFIRQDNGFKKHQVLSGSLYLFLTVIISTALSYGLIKFIQSLQPVYSAWNNYTLKTQIIAYIIPTLLTGLCFHLFTRTYSFKARLYSLLLFFSLMSLVTLLLLPGASYLYAIPLISGVISELLIKKIFSEKWRLKLNYLTSFILIIIYASFSFSIMSSLQDALTLPFFTLLIPFLFAPLIILMVLLASLTTVEIRVLKAATVIALLIAIINIVQLPKPITNSKRLGTSIYFENKSQAYWLVMDELGSIPKEIKDRYKLQKHSPQSALYPYYSYGSMLKTDKHNINYISEIMLTEPEDGVKQLSINIPASDSHAFVKLMLPAQFVVKHIDVNGKPIELEQSQPLDKAGFRTIRIYNHFSHSTSLTLSYSQDANKNNLDVVVMETIFANPVLQSDDFMMLFNRYYNVRGKAIRTVTGKIISL